MVRSKCVAGLCTFPNIYSIFYIILVADENREEKHKPKLCFKYIRIEVVSY